MAAKLKLDLLVDDKGSVVVKKFGKSAETAFSGAKLAAVGMGVGIAGGVASLYALSKVMSEVVGLANIQEKAETKLGAVIRATGQAAGFNLAELKKMAAGMQDTSAIGDDVILSGMAILGTFKQIRGEGFERATQAALDMSSVMGTDLKSSMVMIGKAMNDPIANLSAMSRSGVQFTKDQKEMIKTLWEAGKTTEAHAIILKELESQFGGTALAIRKTFGGAMKAAKNTLGDTKEELGYVITKNQFMIDLVKMAEGRFESWGKYIKENRDFLQSLTKSGILYMVDGFIATIKVMKFLHLGWLGLRKVGNLTIRGLVEGVKMLYEGMRFLLKPFDIFFKVLVAAGKIGSNPFDDMDAALGRLSLSVDDVTEDIKRETEDTKKVYDGVIGKVEDWRKGIAAIPVAQSKATKKVKKDFRDLGKSISKDNDAMVNSWGDSMVDMAEAGRDLGKSISKDNDAMVNSWGDSMVDMVESGSSATTEMKGDMTGFFAGVAVGFADLEKNQKTWADHGKSTFNDFTTSSKRSLASFIDPMKADFLDLETAWKSMLTSMSESLTTSVADMAMDLAIGGVGRWISSGGIGDAADWLKSLLDAGAWEIKKDHIALLHAGEMVIPAAISSRIRSGQEAYAASFPGMTGPSSLGKGRDDEIALAGLHSAMKSMTTFGSKGLAHIGKGGKPSAVVGALPFAVQGAMFAAVEEMAAEALGLNAPAADIGSLVMGILGGILGGPAGAAAGRSLGRPVGLGIADYFNLRELEEYWDFLEDRYGWWASHPKFGSSLKGKTSTKDLWDFVTDPGTSDEGAASAFDAAAGGQGAAYGEGAVGMGDTAFAKFGGIFSGPESGYRATLHGTELIVSPKGEYPATVHGGGEMTIRVFFNDDRLRDLIRFEADGVRIEDLRRDPGMTRMYHG